MPATLRGCVQAPPHAAAVIIDILIEIGAPGAEVTSVGRDTPNQARVMLQNCLKGIDAQLILYKPAGRSVIQVVADAIAKIKPQILAAMEAQIDKVGLEKVTHHAVTPDSPVEVVDLDQSSIPEPLHGPFIAACESDPRISKILVENENKCFHLEILKSVAS